MKATLSSNHATVPAIIGHRGACGHVPENTLASIRKAHALGVRWVEFDVKITNDGGVVVFHDDTLDRTTSGEGKVSEHPLDHVLSLDAGAWFSEDFAGEKVPTLRSAIALLSELGMDANIEIKPEKGLETETAEAVCRVIWECWPDGKPLPLISSFSDASLAVARDSLAECERALLVLEVPDDWEARASALACSAMHVWFEPLSHEQVEAMNAAGYPVRCYTVNDPEIARRLWDWGVESVVSDFPDRMPG